MSEMVSGGQRFTVGFLVLCCALGLLNVARGLISGSRLGILFALAQIVFILFAGTAAWNIYRWKKVGWYLGFLVVLQWLSGIVNLRGEVGWLTLALTVPMAALAIWLYLPAVRARFNVKKVFG
jgi:hypothetical protein